MQELLGRIARLDPNSSLGLRVIACFDELIVGNVNTRALLAAAASLAFCSSSPPTPSARIRSQSRAPVPPPSATSAVERPPIRAMARLTAAMTAHPELVAGEGRACTLLMRAMGGRVAYALGYTGLGVASTRFGARVALDLVDGVQTERTSLAMVRDKPVPFPPEPFRYLGVQATRAALAREDRTGRRGPLLRTLDAFGVGFDS